jgi:hypothetical protein
VTDVCFSGLFDDASQFPPGDLDLGGAVAAHSAWRGGEHSDLVGRFLVPLGRVPAFAEMAPGEDRRWDVGVIVPGGTPPAAARATADALRTTPVAVTAVEMPAAAAPDAITAWRTAFPQADLFLEGRAGAVAAIHALGAKAKIRCGGDTAAAVPTPDELAAFIGSCAGLAVPFKATAGLHQPLRHRDENLGFDQYGFLNLWAATALAGEGASTASVTRALLAEDLETLRLNGLDMEGARELFEAFGTCSISEPIAALIDLRLLDA